MLRNNGDEPLQATQDSSVDDHRSGGRFVCCVVGGSVFEVEPLGELEVQLDRSALEGALERVTDGDVDLRTVESAVSWIELPFTGVFFVEGTAELL